MRAILTILALCAALVAGGARAQPHGDARVPMRAVGALDLDRYMGRWYGIARYPNWFERGCAGVTVEYARLPDGRVSVRNACRRTDGRQAAVEGVASPVSPGRLAVRFARVPFVTGDYVVLHVSPGYDLAVVGEARRRYGWVLARTPTMTDSQWRTAREVLARNGYRPEALERVIQP